MCTTPYLYSLIYWKMVNNLLSATRLFCVSDIISDIMDSRDVSASKKETWQWMSWIKRDSFRTEIHSFIFFFCERLFHTGARHHWFLSDPSPIIGNAFHSLTDSLTDSCLVNLIDVTLACEDANSKHVEVVTVVVVDAEDYVGNSLLHMGADVWS